MMREYARSLKFLLLIVVVVFILTSGVLFYFGSGPFGSGKSNAVAVVNGEEIPPERFKRAQANMMAAYARMARQQLTPELAERLGLSQQVINDLVTEAIVIQGAPTRACASPTTSCGPPSSRSASSRKTAGSPATST